MEISGSTLVRHKEKEAKMNAITTAEVKTMMHNIDVRLDQKSHYNVHFGHIGLAYRVGTHKFVTFEDFSRTFEEYETDNKGSDWACYLYILTKNQPELLDFFTRAYNFAGMDALRVFMDKQEYDNPQTEVYLIRKH
ncbi:MAG: hypothetical protein [Namikivirus tsukuho]|uniref:Uncharacterized protein n=1 Tax=Bacteriophage sp. TaxID=38018 RepID=A0ABY5TRG7_9VIRU|nr:MAG: hypothetical protein [Bacteriophage sp.]